MRRNNQGRTHRAFNCGDQATLTWRQRADVCADLIRLLKFSSSGECSIADIGCGDQKLRATLRARGVKCRYQGYDVLPQTPEVERFDVRADSLPYSHDVVVMLGVIEYLENLDGVLMSLARQVPFLIVSHVFRQNDYYTQKRLAELGWRNHLSEGEINEMVERDGFAVIDRCLAPDKRTLLLSCRSTQFLSSSAAQRAR